MKTMKKALALVLALAIVMSLGISAFAAPAHGGGSKDAPQITVENTNPSVVIKGSTITAYKLFKLTYDEDRPEKFSYEVVPEMAEFTYTAPSAVMINGVSTDAITDENLYDYLMAIDGNHDALRKFANYFINDPANATVRGLVPQDTVVAEGETQVIDLKKNDGDHASLGLGYYLVSVAPKRADDGTGAASPAMAVALDSTNYNGKVVVKAEAPKIEKTVDTDKISQDAQIGETVTFTLKSEVPDYTGYKAYEFIISDIMSEGLTIDKDSFEVVVGSDPKVVDVNVTVQYSENDQKFELKLGDDFDKDLIYAMSTEDYGGNAIGDEIVIKYKATLNDKAVNHDYETNKTHISYSTQPNEADGGIREDTPDDVVYVYDMGLNISKVDADATGTKLANAMFVLRDGADKATSKHYKHTANKTEFAEIKTADPSGIPTLAELKAAGCVLTTNDEGALVPYFQGLKAGTYYLEEVKAPDGYNLLKNDIKVEITDNSENGAKKPTEVTYTITNLNDSPASPVAQTYTFGDAAPKAEDALTVVGVGNKSGNELPETGGIGTTIFYTVGAVMMAGALVLLITKKKMSVN